MKSEDTLDDQIKTALPIIEQMKLDKVLALLTKNIRKSIDPCPILFLDIDGVLNGHRAFNNGYNGMERDLVDNLNLILDCEPDVKVVLSSAWRYIALEHEMTLTGLEYMFQSHGVLMADRLHGITGSDEVIQDQKGLSLDYGTLIRKLQIESYVAAHNITFFVVLDDLDLKMPELVQTDGDVGLTADIAKKIIKLFHAERIKGLTRRSISDTLSQ